MFSEILEKPIKYLTLTGIWIDRNSSWIRITLAILSHIIFIDIYMVFVIVHITTVKTATEAFKLLEVVPFSFGLFILTISIIANKTRIENLVEESRKLENEAWMLRNRGNKLQKRINTINNVFKGTFGFLSTFILLRTIICIASQVLPTVIWLPYDYNSSKILFWLTMMHESIGSTVYIPVSIVIDYFFKFFICFATGMIEELNERMLKIMEKSEEDEAGPSCSQRGSIQRRAQKEKKEKERRLKELSECVEVQLRLKKFVSEIESIFGVILAEQGIFTVFIMCTTAVSLTIVSSSNPLL
jgi:hypothetical protein